MMTSGMKVMTTGGYRLFDDTVYYFFYASYPALRFVFGQNNYVMPHLVIQEALSNLEF